MKKLLALILVAGLFVVVGMGCGGDTAKKTTPAAPATGPAGGEKAK